MFFLNLVAGIGIVVNIGVNVYLIPTYGAFGAAIATLITQSLVSLIQIVYSLHLLKIPFSTTVLVQFLFFVGSVTALGYFVRAESLFVLLILLIAGFGAMLLFKLVDLQNLRGLLKQKNGEEFES